MVSVFVVLTPEKNIMLKSSNIKLGRFLFTTNRIIEPLINKKPLNVKDSANRYVSRKITSSVSESRSKEKKTTNLILLSITKSVATPEKNPPG